MINGLSTMNTTIQTALKTMIAVGTLTVPTAAGARNIGQKPNIVFFLVDDLGWADLPLYGNKFNETPHLDKIARKSVCFSNAYAASPVSSPTRASILSGQYPARLGMVDFIPGHWRPFEEVTVPVNRTQFMPENINTIGEMLQKAGYKTGYFGKWHLGDSPAYHPLNQGFDEANVGQGYFNTNFNPPREQSSDKIISKRLTEFGCDFIEKNKDNPFFLFISHWDVHCPLDAEKPAITKYHRKPTIPGYPCNAVYAAMVENIDNSAGQIIEKLKKSGVFDNTIFIFFSDNGGIITENKYPGISEEMMPMIAASKSEMYNDSQLRYVVTTNAPLRSQKGTLYEGGIRVPLIIHWPAKIKKGRVSDALVCSVDFYPSLLGVAGVGNQEKQPIDGKSLLPVVFESKYDSERAVYWHYPVYHHDVPAAAIRKGSWKLKENLVTGEPELYNLEMDISESTDFSAVFPAKTNELLTLLKAWQKEMKAEFPIVNPNFDAERRFVWGYRPQKE